MITVYGIPNCDTVKRARSALSEAGIAYHFHDFRADGISTALVQTWLDAVGGEQLINRKSTTWRQLDDASRAELSGAHAASVLARVPTLIKRPVIASAGDLIVGFAKKDHATLLDRLRPSAR